MHAAGNAGFFSEVVPSYGAAVEGRDFSDVREDGYAESGVSFYIWFCFSLVRKCLYYKHNYSHIFKLVQQLTDKSVNKLF